MNSIRPNNIKNYKSNSKDKVEKIVFSPNRTSKVTNNTNQK